MYGWEVDWFIFIYRVVSRSMVAPFIVPKEDRAVVTGLWLILWVCLAASAIFALREIWVGAALAGVVVLILLFVTGMWGD
jgi:hypothetical protein